MLRIAFLLLVFYGGLHVGSSHAGSPYAGSPYAGSPYATSTEIETLNESQSAFNLGGSRISVEIRDRVLRGKKDMLLEWIVYSAQTVSQYYGRFPVDTVHINVQVTGGHTVRFGQAFGGESPFVRVKGLNHGYTGFHHGG